MGTTQFTFSGETAAKAAVKIIASYGYVATATGRSVWTDCPPLLAIPAVGRTVGLHEIENVRLVASPAQRTDAAECSSAAA
jgi:hypothetical protein